MEKEKQVCTIEQGSKLRSFGICKSALSWYARKLHKESEYKNIVAKWHPVWDKETTYSYYSELQLAPAFSTSELGEMMPSTYFTRRSKSGWNIYEIKNGEITSPLIDWNETEAEARAQLIIYLLENNMIKPEEIQGDTCVYR